MIKIYGIKNCDTVKKARAWLDKQGIAHQFHDFRADGLDAGMMTAFVAGVGWEALLNTRGTTWRKLDETDKAGLDAAKAAALMLEHEALIKRPVWQKGSIYRLGFAAKDMPQLEAWLKN